MWTPNDALRFTKGVTSDKSKKRWSVVANSVLQSGGDEAQAIRMANGVTRDAIRRKLTNQRSITGAK